MNPYLASFKSHILQHRSNFADADTLLEMIYLHYSEFNPMETEKIRACYRRLEDILCPLTEEGRDAVFTQICTLCAEQEKAAFLEGFRTGARLMMEMEEICD